MTFAPLLALLLLISSRVLAFDPSEWISGSRISVPAYSDWQRGPYDPTPSIEWDGNMALQFHSDAVHNPMLTRPVGCTANTWCRVTPDVPFDAIAIHVAGLLIITNGKQLGGCSFELWFRRDASIPKSQIHYNSQVVSTRETSGWAPGIREPVSTWIPLALDQTFEYRWEPHGPWGGWPQGCALRANLRIVAILQD